jgi:hypothetical protein
MTSNALLIHSLQEKLNHTPSNEDNFFARGHLATALHTQAIALAYFNKLEYEEAVRQIHRDFALKGTPYESKSSTLIIPETAGMLVKHFNDTCEGRRRVELNNCWVIEQTKGIHLRPQFDSLVEFDHVNLLTAKVYYRHELEDVTCSFSRFLTEEDCKAFTDLAKAVLARLNR